MELEWLACLFSLNAAMWFDVENLRTNEVNVCFKILKVLCLASSHRFFDLLKYEVENEKLTTTLKCSVMGVAPLSAYSR